MTRPLHHGIYEALLDQELKEALDRHPRMPFYDQISLQHGRSVVESLAI